MTVTTFVSCKGAPGVTTLACLVGATWPDERRVVVVEADYFGGDLAARFRLPVSRGWTSFVTAARRSGGHIGLEPHLQALPGGLDVMIGARGGRLAGADLAVATLIESCGVSGPTPRDLVIDGGRLLLEDPGHPADWLDHSDSVVVVLRRDAASILNVRDQTRTLEDRWGSRVGLVVVGDGRHHAPAIEEFTGLPVIGEVPFDQAAARVASGEGGAGRHLLRSPLVVSARRLAAVLAGTHQGPVAPDLAEEDGGSGIDLDPRPLRPATGGGDWKKHPLSHLRHGLPKPRFRPLRLRARVGGGSQRALGVGEGLSGSDPVAHPAAIEGDPATRHRRQEAFGPDVTPQQALR